MKRKRIVKAEIQYSAKPTDLARKKPAKIKAMVGGGIPAKKDRIHTQFRNCQGTRFNRKPDRRGQHRGLVLMTSLTAKQGGNWAKKGK